MILGSRKPMQDNLSCVSLPVRPDVEPTAGRHVRYAAYGLKTVGDTINFELTWIMANGSVDGAVLQFIECMAMLSWAAFGEFVKMVGTRQVSDHYANRMAFGM